MAERVELRRAFAAPVVTKSVEGPLQGYERNQGGAEGVRRGMKVTNPQRDRADEIVAVLERMEKAIIFLAGEVRGVKAAIDGKVEADTGKTGLRG